MTRVIVPLLAGCLLLAGCPHDFSRARQDAAAPDVASDMGTLDLPAQDATVPDARVQLDVVPTPDAACPLPCVTTLPGSYSLAEGVALGVNGEVYVAETDAHRIKVHVNGITKVLAGSGLPGFRDDLNALAAQFDNPMGVAVDASGAVYVADKWNNRIRKIAGGSVITLAGNGTDTFADGPAGAASFWNPSGVTVDSAGTVYVADYFNDRIRAIQNGVVSTFAGDGTLGDTDGPAKTARFYRPIGVIVDGNGVVYVSDCNNHLIREIESGEVTTLAGDGSPGARNGPAAGARFDAPWGIAVDAGGTVYVSDTNNHRIRRIKGGVVDTLAGTGFDGYRDGPASTAWFSYPAGLALDSSGSLLYVADSNNNRIRVIQLK